MSSISSLVYVQQCLSRYIVTIYGILGVIGVCFNITIFSQPTYRKNPTSLYILSMSLCSLISLLSYLIPTFYAIDHPDLSTSYLVACHLIYYFRYSFNQMMRTFLVLACADRYAVSSNQVRIRSFSQYRVVIYLIPSVILFWMLLSIFPLSLRSLVNGVCDATRGVNVIIFSINGAIMTGILPLFCMIIFSILLSINLKNIRRRIQPMTNTSALGNQILRKRDRDMLRMLLIEVVCFATTTGPIAILYIYQVATNTIIKSNERVQTESFVRYFTTSFLIYLTNSLSFWIYIYTSQSFRSEFKKLIMKSYSFITNKQIQIHEIN